MNKSDQIEETLAHQQQEIQDLSDMVTRQWDEIDILKKQITRLRDKIEMMGKDDGEDTSIPADVKPPHY